MRLKQVALLGALLALGTLTASLRALPQQDANAGSVTFNKQVLPILQKNCQSCHRPGEIAPMSFLTYQERNAELLRRRPHRSEDRCGESVLALRTESAAARQLGPDTFGFEVVTKV
ncbi:MAG: hypothetical protein DMF97_11835 [Acidobacteria bacterium]|nr:MAG: hypothetical protein DMF97_11835 [Acidobacteriota bacterium]